MKDKIEQILSDAKEKIMNAVAESELQKVRSDIIGKQGELALLLKGRRLITMGMFDLAIFFFPFSFLFFS